MSRTTRIARSGSPCKRAGADVEAFSETCEACKGRGFLVHADPVDKPVQHFEPDEAASPRARRKRAATRGTGAPLPEMATLPEENSPARAAVKATLATIAAAAAHAHEAKGEPSTAADQAQPE
jgi:ribonuclease E